MLDKSLRFKPTKYTQKKRRIYNSAIVDKLKSNLKTQFSVSNFESNNFWSRAADLGHVDKHEAGVHRHDHLVLDLRQVLRQGVDRGADTTSHGDGILGITHAIL